MVDFFHAIIMVEDNMKVISIKQPWATLIAKGYKTYEFRSWKTKYRGEIYIHASKVVEKDKLDRFKHLSLDYPTGKIIAKATLTDCIEVDKQFEEELIKKDKCIYGASSNRNGYAFKLEKIEELEEYIEAKGQLGIWNYK